MLSAFFGGLFVPFGDAVLSFDGNVTNKSGDPISGAKIEIFFDEEQNVSISTGTDLFGEYTIHEIVCPCEIDFIIVVNKPGYKSWKKPISLDSAMDLKVLNVTLNSNNK